MSRQPASDSFVMKAQNYIQAEEPGWIMRKVLFMQENPERLKTRISFAGKFLICLIFLGAAASHLIKQSFPIYLKYQGLIDAYYYKQLKMQQMRQQEAQEKAVSQMIISNEAKTTAA